MNVKLRQGIKVLFKSLPFLEKYLHFAVMIGVLFQLISSSLMHVHGDTQLDNIADLAFIHIYAGLVLFPLSIIFAIKVIMRRKLLDLYPWFFGRYEGIKEDIECLLKGRLPEPKPAGLAATVEGLGLLALLLALTTGGMWFLVVNISGPSELLLSVHKLCVTFIQIYFFAHGAFALLHLFKWWRE
ncbi:cytochrome b/b6 domain-containing protein [Shewanella sp. 0m-4]